MGRGLAGDAALEGLEGEEVVLDDLVLQEALGREGGLAVARERDGAPLRRPPDLSGRVVRHAGVGEGPLPPVLRRHGLDEGRLLVAQEALEVREALRVRGRLFDAALLVRDLGRKRVRRVPTFKTS